MLRFQSYEIKMSQKCTVKKILFNEDVAGACVCSILCSLGISCNLNLFCSPKLHFVKSKH